MQEQEIYLDGSLYRGILNSSKSFMYFDYTNFLMLFRFFLYKPYIQVDPMSFLLRFIPNAIKTKLNLI